MKWIAVAVTYLFLLQNADAYEKTENKWYTPDWSFEMSFLSSSHKIKADAGYRSLFVPYGGSMNLDFHTAPLRLKYRLEFTPISKRIGYWNIGLPVSYGVLGWVPLLPDRAFPLGPFFIFREPIETVRLDWWDPVKAYDLVIEYCSPRAGLRFSAKNKYSFSFSSQYYRILERTYKGRDCQGCVNTEGVYFVEELDSGMSLRFDFSFIAIDRRKDPNFMHNSSGSLFIEKIGPKTWIIGLVIGTMDWLDR